MNIQSEQLKNKYFLGLIFFLLIPFSLVHAGLNFNKPKLIKAEEESLRFPQYSFGGSILLMGLMRIEDNSDDFEGLYLMNAAPKITVNMDEKSTAVFSYNFAGGPYSGPLDAWVSYNSIKWGALPSFNLKAGQFLLPFGLAQRDHTALVRRAYNFRPWDRDVGVLIQGRSSFIKYTLGYINGNRSDDLPSEGDYGLLADLKFYFQQGSSSHLGFSYLKEANNGNGNRSPGELMALYTMIRFKYLVLSGEVDYSQNYPIQLVTSSFSGSKSLGCYVQGKLFFSRKSGMDFRVGRFSSNIDYFADRVESYKIGLFTTLRKSTHAELAWRNYRKIGKVNTTSFPLSDNISLLISLHF